MAAIGRILLIDSQAQDSCETDLVLKIGGYQVEVCTDVDIAINRFNLYRSTDSRFDMVVAATDNTRREVLERLYRERYIDYLVLFCRQLACKKFFCIDGQLAYLCNSTALLACIKTLQIDSDFASRVMPQQVVPERGEMMSIDIKQELRKESFR